MSSKKFLGFTLVELLVVISIIGILSSFAVVQLNQARIKARDALRKGDMSQMRTALNLYYDDELGYPICGTWSGTSEDFGATADCYNGALTTALSGGTRPYMANIPTDPKNPTNSPSQSATYLYRYVSNGSEYAITYRLEESTALQVIRGW